MCVGKPRTLGNVGASPSTGKPGGETLLAGCPGRIRTGLRRFRTGLSAASVLVIGGRRNGCALGANSLDAMFLVGRYLARNRGSYQPGEPRPKRRTTGSQSLRQQRAAVGGIDVAAMFAEGHQLMPSARRGFRRAASAGCFRPKRRLVALGAVVLGPDSLSAGHRQVDLPGEQIRHGRTGAAVVLPASDEDSTNRSVCRSAGAVGGQPVIMRIRTRSRRTK
jgi:hypothetical protein